MTSCPGLRKEGVEQSVLAGSRSQAVDNRLAQLIVGLTLWMLVFVVQANQIGCEILPGQGPDMVYLPGGTFTLGSPPQEKDRDDDEGPQTRIWVAPFALMRCEVTLGEFRAFVKETGYDTNMDDQGCYTELTQGSGDWAKRDDRDWSNGLRGQTDNHPVICVNWNDAQAYARWLSLKTGAHYRLPSEAEFEYVLRANSNTPYPWDQHQSQCTHANGPDSSAKMVYPSWMTAECYDDFVYTAPVANFLANPFGLYDLSGNVWEWTQDCWNDRHGGQDGNGAPRSQGNCDRRVLRGGSWSYEPYSLRSAFRDGYTIDGRYDNVGFRLARDL